MDLKETLKLHSQWKKRLLASKQWDEEWPRFWFGSESHRSSLREGKDLVRERRKRERLQRDLLRLSKKYDLMIATNKKARGVFSGGVEASLKDAYRENQNHIARTAFAYADQLEFSKPGPDRLMPVFLGESLLVALELHRDSKAGLRQIHDFLMSDEFESHLRKARWSDDQIERIRAFGGGFRDPGEWRSKKKQQLERLVLSESSGRVIKSFSKHRPALSRVRRKISAATREIVQAIRAKQPA